MRYEKLAALVATMAVLGGVGSSAWADDEDCSAKAAAVETACKGGATSDDTCTKISEAYTAACMDLEALKASVSGGVAGDKVTQVDEMLARINGRDLPAGKSIEEAVKALSCAVGELRTQVARGGNGGGSRRWRFDIGAWGGGSAGEGGGGILLRPSFAIVRGPVEVSLDATGRVGGISPGILTLSLDAALMLRMGGAAGWTMLDRVAIGPSVAIADLSVIPHAPEPGCDSQITGYGLGGVGGRLDVRLWKAVHLEVAVHGVRQTVYAACREAQPHHEPTRNVWVPRGYAGVSWRF